MQHRHCGLAERHPVLAGGFRAVGRNHPYFLLEVYLRPRRAEHLAAAARGQDQEFQAARVYSSVLPQPAPERADLAPRQRRVVCDGLPRALARAATSDTAVRPTAGPRPISRILPLRVYRKTQNLDSRERTSR